jgi:hypothetical protein
MKEDRMKADFLQRFNLKEAWVIFFILGIIMMNYPFINIFDVPAQLFGMPVLFEYLYYGWLVSIFVIFIFVRAIDLNGGNNGERH